MQNLKTQNQLSDTSCPNCGESVPVIAELQKDVAELKRQVKNLDRQVHTDTLTGLFNYRHFSEALDKEMERSKRSGRPTGLIMVDLDHFKHINDEYGHEAGNIVLQDVSALLRAATRKLDIPCRYGGEEFAIILPSTDLLTSGQVAERLRSMIAADAIDIGDARLNVTASLGVDVYSHFHDETQDAFVKRVDDLLYKAKRGGRNRVCCGHRRDLQRHSNVNADEKDALRQMFSNPRDPGK